MAEVSSPDRSLNGKDEVAWRDIEATLGPRGLSIAVRRRIADAVARHQARQSERTGPRISFRDMRKRLRRGILFAAGVRSNQQAPLADRQLAAIFEDRLMRKLATIDPKVSGLLPARGGRRAELRALVRELAKVWREVTGQRPSVTTNPYDGDGTSYYRGKFLTFVTAVLQAGDITIPRSNIAFGKQVQRALKC